ncbi:glycosyltransferase [Cyclobacterium roseum]|uniref:glycosyltransferase n=1 Tax=Cyclobacterium roseum TaxID=2666137 RepID=UPI001390AFDF|nr:glycosyltransferase [Cyclobacterium roseum]
MAILHLSFDYPDDFDRSKTKAVSNLVNSQNKYENLVISLNRTANPFSGLNAIETDFGYAMKIFGLPFGIGLSISMYLASKRVLGLLDSKSHEITLIHAHKLTFEGVMAYWLSKWLSVPYIITVRGDSDLKVIRHKPLFKPFLKKVLKKSSKIIYLAPWTMKQLENHFNGIHLVKKSVLLPNIIDPKQQITPGGEKRYSRFITVFKLDSHKRKNIKRVIKAFDRLHRTIPDVGLDIVGSGTEKSKIIIQKYINSCQYPFKFKLLGQMSHDELIPHYQRYLGFILPSNPETFGLVFVEALYAGLPIIYAKNAGVDGLFDSGKLGIKVESSSVNEIGDAIEELYRNNEDFNHAVEDFKVNDGLKKFSEKYIGGLYMKVVTEECLN